MRKRILGRSVAVLSLLLFGLASVVALAITTQPDVSGERYDWKKTGKLERPSIHQYDQTVAYKIFLAAKLPGDQSQVFLTFEQALGVIKRIDNMTCGVPKIAYLVGWQYNGHDSKYPAWDEVNQRLKRAQDATALDSMKWLMAEGTKYHTIVSVHINMMDAYEDSPLWKEYVAKDVIAKDKNGRLIKAAMWPKNSADEITAQSYNISYAREWEVGLAQRRIDRLLAMLPIQEAGTVHIDAFHSIPPTRMHDNPPPTSISPYLGYTLEQEAGAQRKIIRYFRDKGVDVTAEVNAKWRVDSLVGLQPMAYHYTQESADIPASLYCGTPLEAAEGIIKRDPEKLPGMLEQFCMHVVPWFYANNTTAAKGEQAMITNPVKRDVGGQEVETGTELCMPALWAKRGGGMLVAFSAAGYKEKRWELPPGWEGVTKVRVSEITGDGGKFLYETGVESGGIVLRVGKGEGVVVEGE